jgi:hypothetical protein
MAFELRVGWREGTLHALIWRERPSLSKGPQVRQAGVFKGQREGQQQEDGWK